MVLVRLESIHTGACTDNVGFFSGQNIQNSWDSHTPAIVSFGFVMGDYCIANSIASILWNHSTSCQPIYDSDTKETGSSQFVT